MSTTGAASASAASAASADAAAAAAAANAAAAKTNAKRELIDIGANLLDPVFRGTYHDKKRHDSDFDLVLERAREHGTGRIIVTAGSLEESREALALARSHENLYCTVGVHPTRCNEFGYGEGGAEGLEKARAHVQALLEVARDGMRDGKVV